MVNLFTTSKKPTTRRVRRVDGFKVGLSLILLSFALMGVRTYFTYIDSKVDARFNSAVSKSEALRNIQKADGKLGISHMTSRPVAVDIPVYAFNPRLGRAGAPIQIKVFSNPTCGECRETVQTLARVTRQHISQVSLVVKTIPKPSGYNFQDVALNRAIEAGLFATLATEQNEYWDFIKQVDALDMPSADSFVTILSELGLSLREIRTALAQNNERYLRQMEQDMALMEALNESQLPVVIVNDTLIEPLYGQDMATQAAEAARAFLR